MNKSTLITIGKIGYILIIMGFFYPIIFDLNGFEMVSNLSKANQILSLAEMANNLSNTNQVLSLAEVKNISSNIIVLNISLYVIFILPCICILVFLIFKVAKIYYDTTIDFINIIISMIAMIIVYVEFSKLGRFILDLNNIIGYSRYDGQIKNTVSIQSAPYLIIIGIIFSAIFAIVTLFEKEDTIEGLKDFRIKNLLKRHIAKV